MCYILILSFLFALYRLKLSFIFSLHVLITLSVYVCIFENLFILLLFSNFSFLISCMRRLYAHTHTHTHTHTHVFIYFFCKFLASRLSSKVFLNFSYFYNLNVCSKYMLFSTFIFIYFFTFIFRSVTRVFPNRRCGLRTNDIREVRPLYADVMRL